MAPAQVVHRRQRPEQAVLGVAASSADSVGDEVGDKLGQTPKTKGVTPRDYALINQMVPKRGFP